MILYILETTLFFIVFRKMDANGNFLEKIYSLFKFFLNNLIVISFVRSRKLKAIMDGI
jgi:hypothetical protein